MVLVLYVRRWLGGWGGGAGWPSEVSAKGVEGRSHCERRRDHQQVDKWVSGKKNRFVSSDERRALTETKIVSPAEMAQRTQSRVDKKHQLWKLWEEVRKQKGIDIQSRGKGRKTSMVRSRIYGGEGGPRSRWFLSITNRREKQLIMMERIGDISPKTVRGRPKI